MSSGVCRADPAVANCIVKPERNHADFTGWDCEVALQLISRFRRMNKDVIDQLILNAKREAIAPRIPRISFGGVYVVR